MLAAAIQMNSQDDKEKNIRSAEYLIDIAAERGANLAVLPEMFNFLGPRERRPFEAEQIPGPTIQRIMAKAVQHHMGIIAGSILESSPQPGKVYNTSVFINSAGHIIARYRKLHLFDVVVEGQPPYEESATIIQGDEIVVAETDLGKLGFTICYDIRFPQLYCQLSNLGAQIISLPAAFTLHTGLAHWEVLIRARAIENLCYVIAAAQVGLHPVDRECYGNSMIVDPWGTVLARAPTKESVIIAAIDLHYLHKVRSNLPSLTHRRNDLYP
jgi:predicted amidohydrolase